MLELSDANDVISGLKFESSNRILVIGEERLTNLGTCDALGIRGYILSERKGERYLALAGWFGWLITNRGSYSV